MKENQETKAAMKSLEIQLSQIATTLNRLEAKDSGK